MPHTSSNASLIKSTGGFGSIFVTDTSLYTGDFFAIQAIEDSIFGTLSSNNMTNCNTWVSGAILFPAGIVITSEFTDVKLNSGKIILYKH